MRSLSRLGNARDHLTGLMTDSKAPLGLRREVLRTFAQTGDGGHRLLAMVRDHTLPEALKIETATALRTRPDRQVRGEVEKLLPITSAPGEPLPSIYELIRRDGIKDAPSSSKPGPTPAAVATGSRSKSKGSVPTFRPSRARPRGPARVPDNLKQPVSIIGRFDALTLTGGGANKPRVNPKAKI